MTRRITDYSVIIISVALAAFIWRSNSRLNAVERNVAEMSDARSTVTVQVDTGTTQNVGASFGSQDAPVTIVQFTDYECPFCARFTSETLPLLREEYIQTGKVRLVVRDLPLDMHKSAMPLAIAARCGYELSREALDFQRLLYSNLPTYQQTIAAAADSVGISHAALTRCMEDGRHRVAVTEDVEAARQLRVRGTPTFVIGRTSPEISGRIIRGAMPTPSFTAAIDSLLDLADGGLDDG